MKRKTQQEGGQGLVEYALILVLVAVVVIAVLTLLGPQVGNVFSRVVNGLGVVDSSGGSGGGGGNPSPTANLITVTAFRSGGDVVVQVQVTGTVNITAVDSQSGKTASMSCPGSGCSVNLPSVGPNPGSITVTADGGNSLSASYPAQN